MIDCCTGSHNEKPLLNRLSSMSVWNPQLEIMRTLRLEVVRTLRLEVVRTLRLEVVRTLRLEVWRGTNVSRPTR